LMKISNSNSQSNITEITGASEKSISNQVLRLGWASIAGNNILRDYLKVKGYIVIDGLENKIVSKQCPHDVNIAYDSCSGFIIGYNNSYYRSKGRQTDAQKERQKKYNKILFYEKQSTRKSMESLLFDIYNYGLKDNLLYTDEKKEYKQARKILQAKGYHFRHKTISSKAFRNGKNPIAIANMTERDIRKDLEPYKRKTTYVAKDMSNSMVKMIIYSFYHNFLKQYRKNDNNSGFHYMYAGIDQKIVDRVLKEVFEKRLFYSCLNLTKFEEKVWIGKVPGPFGDRKYPLPAYALK